MPIQFIKIINVQLFFFSYLIFSLSLPCLSENMTKKEENYLRFIEIQCKSALGFYKERPDLETEYLRRLEFCKDTSKAIGPEGYNINPILSDFASMYGVNGRTRMQIHQGIDIIGSADEPIIAIADGVVLEVAIANCVGPTLVIDHGKSFDNKKLITLYSHVGDIVVEEEEVVKRGMIVAKLPKKVEYPCMARVRHLHLQIGQQYCEKEEKGNWGCEFFIKDLYNSLNPNHYWTRGPNNITCFEKSKTFKEGTITYPFQCKTSNLD